MSIGTQERPINIKDLILEEPERTRELPFDPEKEITEEQQEKLRAGVKRQKEVSWSSFAEEARNFQILFPDSPSLFTDTDWTEGMKKLQEMQKEILPRRERRQSTMQEFLRLAASMKLLLPRRSAELKDLLSSVESEFFGICDWGETQRMGGKLKFIFVPENILYTRMLFPSMSLDKRSFRHSIDALCQWLAECRKGAAWTSFTRFATCVRLLAPERPREIELDKKVWEELRTILHTQLEQEGQQLEGAFFLAKNMAILAAPVARLTNDGFLDIQMFKSKPDFAPQTPPMPEVRRF